MFLQDQVLNNTYQILRPIGNGGTSSVYLGYHLRLRKYVVIKQLRGSFSEDFLMRTEVDILKNLHYPNLPQVYDFIQDQGSVYTIIDYVDGYDLVAYIKAGQRLPEEHLKRYLRQIAEVLDYLHSQNPPVIHSDIKPGNIIINQEGNAILIDFNTSIGGNQGNLLGLTLPYASPEQIQLAQHAVYGQRAGFELDGRSDLYSLGATFYELITGIRPQAGTPPKPLHTLGLSEYSRDFLMLIDRLMEYDRDKRIKSAKKLATAVERLGGRYWTYFSLRCVSVLLSVALIAGGIYCCISGSRRAVMEDYRAQYDSALVMIAQGDLDRAEDVCDDILASDEMQAYLQDNPSELAGLYHAMGDIFYYREDYNSAAAYYEYAVDCSNAEESAYAMYIRDSAIAYAQCGDLESAKSKLRLAEKSNASTDDLRLVSAVIAAREGNVDQCLQDAQWLLQNCSQKQICLRAMLCAASVVEDLDVRIQWLVCATDYDDGKTASRRLAAAYVEKAKTKSDAAALQNAIVLYEKLCDSDYASSADQINYSVALRMNGERQQAAVVLKNALENDPNNYRILANLCFVHYEIGDESMTAYYCEAAIQAWRTNTSPDRLSESSEEIQNLFEIGRRYGIGGV